MSSIIIHAAPGPSNFERGSERWETKLFGYHKANNENENYQLPPDSVSWLDNIYIPVCPLHSSQPDSPAPRVVCLARESIPDQLRRYTGELRQSRRGNGYQEHHDHHVRVLGSCVSSDLFTLRVVCFVNFCTINWIKRFSPQDVAEL